MGLSGLVPSPGKGSKDHGRERLYDDAGVNSR